MKAPIPSYPLRVSPILLTKIKYLSKLHKRSANKEIEYVLEQYIDAYERVNGAISTCICPDADRPLQGPAQQAESMN